MVKIVDLSVEMYTDMPVFERGHVKTRPQVYVHNRPVPKKTQKYGETVVSTTEIIFCDHVATHVDSTIHYSANGYSAEKIPLEYMYGDGVVLDLRHKKGGELISVEDMERACEKARIQIKPMDIVLINTGRWRKWGTPAYTQDSVGIDRKAAEWLLSKGVKVYGIDSMSTDLDLESATHMLIRDIPHHIMENLTNLDDLPPRFRFVGFPMKITGASAAPIRAVAVVED